MCEDTRGDCVVVRPGRLHGGTGAWSSVSRSPGAADELCCGLIVRQDPSEDAVLPFRTYTRSVRVFMWVVV